MSYNNSIEPNPKFKSNDKIIISKRSSKGHCRTPAYIRGKTIKLTNHQTELYEKFK